MIQVDVFWSFAMGGMFACCAGHHLSTLKNFYENKYFAYTVCFLSMAFAPSGAYLLNRNPGWETMFVYNKDSFGIKSWQEALIPTAFACTNTLLGVLGFALNYKLMKAGQRTLANVMWISSYQAMFAILGFGYGRFFYAGDAETWKAQKEHRLEEFFQCEIFYTLLAMGLVIAPGLLIPILGWQAKLDQVTLSNDRKTLIITFLFNCALMAAGYHLYLNHYGETERQRILTGFGARLAQEKEWGIYAPLVMCYVGNFVAGTLFISPTFLAKGKHSKTQ